MPDAQKFALLALVFGLAACAPVPVEQAERACLRSAELARQPKGDVTLGVAGGDDGIRATGGMRVEISSDYVMGRDPSDVFNRCVVQKSGQMPNRVLAEQPGWRG